MINKISLFFYLLIYSQLSFGQSTFSDCSGAIILCNNDELVVSSLDGAGAEKFEIGFTACSERLEEKHSAWIKWQVGNSGTIGFTIEALEPLNDIDFILYKISGPITGCSQKTILRCMSSGLNLGQGQAAEDGSYECLKPTGLSSEGIDEFISDGCNEGGNGNFLAEVEAEKDDCFLLYVNNYYNNVGFRIKWTGTAEFVSPTGSNNYSKSGLQPSKNVYSHINQKTMFQQLGMDSESRLEKAFVARLAQSTTLNTFSGCQAHSRESENESKEELVIGQLFPNPATYQVSVNINAPYAAMARIEVYDLLGKLQSVREAVIEKGEQIISMPTDKFSEGVYAVCIRLNGKITTRKLVVSSLK